MMVVGSPTYDAEGLRNAGEAYVFGSDGSLQLILRTPDPQMQARFGIEVAFGKDVILVGASRRDVESVLKAGAVHVYDTEGVYLTTLTSPSVKNQGFFGDKLAANEEFILVGEAGEHDNPPFVVGSVHVFDYNLNLVTTLQAPEQVVRTGFGVSIAIRGETIVIGEVWADVEEVDRAGRAYIFDTDWNHLATLRSTVSRDGGEFGRGTAIVGDLMVVGERRGDVISVKKRKAYIYDLEGNLLSTLASPEPTVGAQLGYKVATDGEIVVVADVEATVEGVSKAGKVHIFAPGPGAEPEAEQEPVSVQEEAKPEAEEKKPGFVIPGFPHASIILGLVIGAFVIWLLQR